MSDTNLVCKSGYQQSSLNELAITFLKFDLQFDSVKADLLTVLIIQQGAIPSLNNGKNGKGIEIINRPSQIRSRYIKMAINKVR